MSSTILYRFRSGTTFEALPLPGSAARLFDVKKAIVAAKKLDQGNMDFDLSVRDAVTDQEYIDDGALLPRGTRLIVQRLPAMRGQGILSKIQRSQFGGGSGVTCTAVAQQPSSDFYTIDSTARDEEEEFVSTTQQSSEEKELAALQAATQSAGAPAGMPRMTMRGGPITRVAGSGPPLPRQQANFHQTARTFNRPNADPELREQEVQTTKKRPTGIPRTFLDMSKPQNVDGADDSGGVAVPRLQPNTIGFEELKTRGGGQSESAVGTKRDLDYALKITATTIPEYLQCPICHGVVRDAVILQWDIEGRTTCDSCIRDALAQNGFRCPLTQQEGVSPDELFPNHALRKAAEQFIKGVMEKMEEIDKQQVEEELMVDGDVENKILEAGVTDKGVVLTRRATIADKKKMEEDPFGGDDDFGGDVFAVEVKESESLADKATETVTKNGVDTDILSSDPMNESGATDKLTDSLTEQALQQSESKEMEAPDTTASGEKETPNESMLSESSPKNGGGSDAAQQPSSTADKVTHVDASAGGGVAKREPTKRRQLPAGYTMGPAGGAAAAIATPSAVAAGSNNFSRGGGGHDDDRSPRIGGGRGTRGEGRGFDKSRYGPRSSNGHGSHEIPRTSSDDDGRAFKRSRTDVPEPSTSQRVANHERQSGTSQSEMDHGGRSADSFRGRGGYGGRGRGPPPSTSNRGGYRGGGGSGRGGWPGEGGRGKGGGGSVYRGRGSYRGRGGRY